MSMSALQILSLVYENMQKAADGALSSIMILY